eukprot:EG_transcript_17594
MDTHPRCDALRPVALAAVASFLAGAALAVLVGGSSHAGSLALSSPLSSSSAIHPSTGSLHEVLPRAPATFWPKEVLSPSADEAQAFLTSQRTPVANLVSAHGSARQAMPFATVLAVVGVAVTSVAALLQMMASRGSRCPLGIQPESLGLRPASHWAVAAVAATDGKEGDLEDAGSGAEPASEEQPTPGPPVASVSKGAPRRKPAGNPKISAKNFVLSDRARAKKVADVTKYIAQAKAEAGAEPLEKAGRVRLVLVASMVVLSESARNIVNLTTQPDMKWTFKEALDFFLSEEAESLRDLMVLEGSYALDLLARQAGRKAVQRFRQAVSPLTSRLPGLEQLGAVRLPFLLPTAA